MSLISNVNDPADRMYIASTIYYICNIYADGKISSEELEREIYEIVRDVLSAYNPDLTEDEIKAKAEELSKQLVNTIKVETIRRRIMGKMKITLR